MMTTTKPTLITSRDQKGIHAIGLMEATYNKAGLTEDQAQRLNENYDSKFTDGLLKLIKECSAEKPTFAEEKEQWRKFYQKHFSLELNFADLMIPQRPAEGLWRLLIIAQGLTLNQTYKAMSNAFKCWKYADDLDKAVPTNARDTKNAYAIWVRDSVEPDEKYLGKSTNQADPNMAIGVTLLERMIHEMIYFDETGKHLDIKGITFCSGSRYSYGCVPCVSWDALGRGVRVDGFGLGNSRAGCGVREAVSI